MKDFLANFLIVLQAVLPLYGCWLLYEDEGFNKTAKMFFYAATVLFLILKTGAYVPEFGSFEDKILWAIPNIFVYGGIVYLLHKRRKKGIIQK